MQQRFRLFSIIHWMQIQCIWLRCQFDNSGLAQLAEQRPVTAWVAGSSPAAGAKFEGVSPRRLPNLGEHETFYLAAHRRAWNSLKMIYIYLSTQKWALDSALIRWNTRCRYSHAGFYDSGQGEYLSAQFRGGVRIRTETGHGVCRERASERVFFYAPKIEKAYEWAKTQIGKNYDHTAIFGLALDRDWRAKDSWFCSELVAKAFEQAGAPLLNPDVDVWRVTPRDILLSLVVFDGGVDSVVYSAQT